MNALVTTALVGTAQRGGDVALDMGAPLDALLAELGTVERERRLLLLAGAQAVYRMAGIIPESKAPAPQSAPAETLPACSVGAAELLRGFFSGTHPELLPEALERLRRAGLRLPFDLLPLALGVREQDQHAALAPVLGERGRWLSQLNPAWAWVRGALIRGAGELPEDAETIWQEGAAGERIAILRQMRAYDPAQAREWLADVWTHEKAERRAELLHALDISLDADDEAFLEAALDDRSAAVRDRAVHLLERLPGSALTQRMIARADRMLSYDGATLKIQPPRAFERDAARDGFIEKPPSWMEGERAWRVMQSLCGVPLAHWQERFGVSPDVLVAAAEDSDWTWPVIEGWTRASELYGGDTWVPALWRVWSELPRNGTEPPPGLRDIMRAWLAMDVARAAPESLALRLLAGEQSDFPMVTGNVLSLLPRRWSVEFAAAYLRGLRAFVSSLTAETTDFKPWDTTLEAATLGLPAECFAAALEPFTLLPEGSIDWSLQQFYRELDNFVDALRLRERLWEEIP